MKLHLIANSHLDPVWLWDWREGLNEGIITCRAILALMEEFPALTYIRGESVIYEHIQKHDPATFARIRARIEEGRWEVVGGTLLQPDTNLPATETLVRQFTSGLGYFERELGVRPRIAWAADSFGHSAGWPEIYAAAGMSGFACSRPMEHDFHLPKPAFWWEGASGSASRLLSWRIPVGWYGTGRDEVPRRLDETLKQAAGWGLENVAAFIGLGNHGGGPSRRQLLDIQAWAAANPQVEVVFSGLERFFAGLREETTELPVVRGELNFTLRGCYASAARYKTAYRRTENLLLAAEKTSSIIGAALDTAGAAPAADLGAAWRAVLFNTFHDILPGSSLERAYDDQFAWLGVGWHEAQQAELAALNVLSQRLDTRVAAPAGDMPCAVPLVVWNPHPWDYEGPVELEACVDYRPIETYHSRVDELPVEVLDAEGEPLAFQRLEVENHFAPFVPWRVRVAAHIRVPALGWQVVSLAWKDQPRLAVAGTPADGAATAASTSAEGGQMIANAFYRIEAKVGTDHVEVYHEGRALFGGAGLRVASYEDAYGSWGGHDGEREADSIEIVKEHWTVQRVETTARGPQKASLWVRLASSSGRSRLELTLSLHRGVERVQVAARLFCDEPGHRVKLRMTMEGEEAEYEVPGGVQKRRPCGEVPGGRWVRTEGFVFASDALFNFDQSGGCLNATLVRSSRYSCSVPTDPQAMPWRPYMDSGEHRFAFALAPALEAAAAYRLADGLEQPLIASPAPAHAGELPKSGSLGGIEPANVRLLAFKPAEARDGGWIVRGQEVAGKQTAAVTWRIGGEKIALGTIGAHRIASWKVSKARGKWRVELCDAGEAVLTLKKLVLPPSNGSKRNGGPKPSIKKTKPGQPVHAERVPVGSTGN